MKRLLFTIISIVLVISCLFSVVGSAGFQIKGDINGDDRATTADARLILRYAAGITNPTSAQKKVADLDFDGVITTEDAKLMLMLVAGLGSDENYITMLISKGFPKSYVEDLLELHHKYPLWQFEPLITNLTWEEAVLGEHTPHNKQLIGPHAPAEFKCNCSRCNGVVQEAGGWVSASEAAVRYYLDPRNFLDEEHIFQFESTLYNKDQTLKGVEAILKPTWMYDNFITYYDTLGNVKTYKYSNGVAPKYSEVIMKAAKESGMSAYYLAAKMVQEVGSASASNAASASGKSAPYNGIYNYYNIGAYTGAGDGLRWANGFLKAKNGASLYEKASVNSKKHLNIPTGSELNYVSEYGGFYRVKVTVSGKTYLGYVPKTYVIAYTTYGRPWDNPYKCIINGAKYIYDSFADTQYTSFLQKFNVNPASENLYQHEYMANIQAAATESEHTYRAYMDNDLLDTGKAFSIPVFKSMPYGEYMHDDAFQAQKPVISCGGYTPTTFTLKWNEYKGAKTYYIYKYNLNKKVYEKIGSTSGLSYKITGLEAGKITMYKVRAVTQSSYSVKLIYSQYSDVFYAATQPKATSGLKASAVSEKSIKLTWNKTPQNEYRVYRRQGTSGEYLYLATVNTNSYIDTDVIPGTSYSYTVRNIKRSGSMAARSPESNKITVKTKGTAPLGEGTVKVNDWLNVRSEPNTKSKIVGQLKNGQKVTILAKSGDFLRISYIENGKNNYGYVHKDFIVITQNKEKCPYKEPTITVREGHSGDNVRWVQWYLYKLNYINKSDINGSFGPTTLGAVKKFQKDKKLDIDGLVGSGTRAALKKAYGI